MLLNRFGIALVDIVPLTYDIGVRNYFNVNPLEYLGRDRRWPRSTWAEIDEGRDRRTPGESGNSPPFAFIFTRFHLIITSICKYYTFYPFWHINYSPTRYGVSEENALL